MDRRIMIVLLSLFLLGCSDKAAEYIKIEDQISILTMKSILEDNIEEIKKCIDFVVTETDRIEPGERMVLFGTYSGEKLVEQDSAGRFNDYAGLIDTLSEAFKNGRIDALSEMKQPVKELTEEEKQQLIKKEKYGRLEKLISDPIYLNAGKARWYIVEQNSKRMDVIVQQKPGYDNLYLYVIFRCKIKENGDLKAWEYGMSALANGEEHMFIEYEGLKYLCTPKRDADGNIEGIAVHIYELNDYIGAILYIEYIDEVRVTCYSIIDGDIGEPLPAYLLEK